MVVLGRSATGKLYTHDGGKLGNCDCCDAIPMNCCGGESGPQYISVSFSGITNCGAPASCGDCTVNCDDVFNGETFILQLDSETGTPATCTWQYTGSGQLSCPAGTSDYYVIIEVDLYTTGGACYIRIQTWLYCYEGGTPSAGKYCHEAGVNSYSPSGSDCCDVSLAPSYNSDITSTQCSRDGLYGHSGVATVHFWV